MNENHVSKFIELRVPFDFRTAIFNSLLIILVVCIQHNLDTVDLKMLMLHNKLIS